ncbi:hypothetical protein D3C78_415830 [compost metagenome]
MVAVAQGDEALFLRLTLVQPVVEAHFQRHFDAGRTVIGVEHPIQAFRGDLHQALGQLDHRLMTETGEDHVLELVDLVLDTLVDAWVGMAEDVDPPGADGIEIALAFEVFQPHAFATLDRNQRQFFVVFHLGAGVPQDLEVTLHPLLVEAHFDSPGDGGSDMPRKPMQCVGREQPMRCNLGAGVAGGGAWRGVSFGYSFWGDPPKHFCFYPEFAKCLLVGCAPVRW